MAHTQASDSQQLTILLLIQRFYPLIGGAEQQSKLLAEALAAQGHHVVVVTGQHKPELPLHEKLGEVEIYRYPYWHTPVKIVNQISMVVAAHFFTRKLRKTVTWDIIHVTQIFWLAAFGVILKGAFHTPVIAKSANSGVRSDVLYFYKTMRFLQYPARLLRIRDYVFKRLDRIVCINKAMLTEFTAVGVPQNKLAYISNGVKTVPTLSPYTRPRGTLEALTLIRVVEQKNPFYHLHVVQALRKQIPSLHYTLAGEGPLLAACESFVQNNNLSEAISLPGAVPHEVVESTYLPNAHVYLHLTQAEGMSNSVLEAMGAGIPIVVSAVPGNTDLAGAYDQDTLNHEGWVVAERALVIKPGASASDAAHAIAEYLSDDSLVARVRTAAWTFVKQTASVETVATQYSALYADLVH